jgi:hypothetical protein
MCTFQVKVRRQSHTAIWNVKQHSLNLAQRCGLKFRNRKVTKHPILSMTYPQIGLYIPVTNKASGTINTSRRQLLSKQEFICKPLRLIPATRTSNQLVLFNCLVSVSYRSATLTDLIKMILLVHSCLKVSRAFQDTTIIQV